MSGRDERPHRAGRGLCQGAGHVARRNGSPIRSSPTCSSSTSATSCRRWPARSVPKAASRWPTVASRLRRGDGHANTRRPATLASATRSRARDFDLGHGDVVIAAITSCTNTSNPSVLIGAGLLARNADAKGLKPKPWVKTSLAPGSQVVAEYLEKSGLQKELDQLGFNLVGFGCTTCIGNSGPLPAAISKTDQRQGPRRRRRAVGQPQLRRPRHRPTCRRTISPRRRWSSPMRWPARCTKDLTTEPLGDGKRRQAGLPEGHLADLAGDPGVHRRRTSPANCSRPQICRRLQGRRELAARSRRRQARPTPGTTSSTYVQNPPYFDGMTQDAGADHRHHERAHPRPVRRQDHHRPHLAGRFDQGGLAGRQIPDRPSASASPTSTSTARGAATMR